MSVIAEHQSSEAPARCGSCDDASAAAGCVECGRAIPDMSSPAANGVGDLWLSEARVPRLWSQVVTVLAIVGVVSVIAGPPLLDVWRPPTDVVAEVLTDAAGGKVSVEAFAHGAKAGVLGETPGGDGFVGPSDVRVAGMVKDGHHDAVVDVVYKLGAASHSESVRVTRAGWFEPWLIDAAPPVLQVETPWPVRVRVAGVAVEPEAVTLAPGVYRAEVDHELLTAGAKTARVGVLGGHVALEPKLSKGASDTASTAVNAVVDECAASKERLTLQADCPFIETLPRVPTPVAASWVIADYPKVTLELDDGEFAVVTSDLGVAVLTLDYDGRPSKTYTCRFNADGVLEVDGADVAWSANPMENLDGCKRGK